MKLSDHLSPAEYEQIERIEREQRWADGLAETEADRRFRRNVWAVAVCGCVAFWTLVAAAIVGVLS